MEGQTEGFERQACRPHGGVMPPEWTPHYARTNAAKTDKIAAAPKPVATMAYTATAEATVIPAGCVDGTTYFYPPAMTPNEFVCWMRGLGQFGAPAQLTPAYLLAVARQVKA